MKLEEIVDRLLLIQKSGIALAELNKLVKPTKKAEDELKKYDIDTNPRGWYR